MLYEVITPFFNGQAQGVLYCQTDPRYGITPSINVTARLHSPPCTADRHDGNAKQLNCKRVADLRITSDNVCYTKLLRLLNHFTGLSFTRIFEIP